MERNWYLRFSVMMAVIALCALSVYPTLSGMSPEQAKNFWVSKKINLGLDLQGGVYMVMGVDFKNRYQQEIDLVKASAQETLQEKQIVVSDWQVNTKGEFELDPRLSFSVPANQVESAESALKTFNENNPTFRFTQKLASGKFELGIARQKMQEINDRTVEQSVEVIRNRIDEFGVSEPTIAPQGGDRVVVELPGMKDLERAKQLIGRTAKLEFKIVDTESKSPSEVMALVEKIKRDHKLEYKEGDSFQVYTDKINELAGSEISKDSEIAFERTKDDLGNTLSWVPVLLKRQVDVSGEHLANASLGFDPNKNNRPMVQFQMKPSGATRFGKLTRENVGKGLAIVLDGIVASAPRINSEIRESGLIEMGQGNFQQLQREAEDLAVVLRAGALPAKLNFQEQRVVGPSLGQDSIRLGVLSGIIGSIAIFVFITLFYKVSGFIAVVSLLINILLVLALLVGLEATLTLPGIAGIALTVGIAVDSNVVIYERIREELLAGKGIFSAVDAGFQKAIRTILDSNATNFAAAVVLMIYGTGAVKGFAVTMIIGIFTTLFTAVFVTRIALDWYVNRLNRRGATTLSI